RVEHLFPAGTMIVATRNGPLLDVDRAVLGRAPELLRRALDTFRQDVSEALAPAHHLGQTVGALDVTPLQFEPQLLAGDVSLLLTLHHPAAEPPELVDVEARPVELGVEPGHAVLVGGDADRPARPRPSLVLRLVHDLSLVGAAPDD